MDNVVFITGLSGAGKTTALKALEDIGFYCVDNIPVEMIKEILLLSQDKVRNIAFGMSFREEEEVEKFKTIVNVLEFRVKILFLFASDEAIIRRYKETRRKHPIQGKTLEESIERERRILEPIIKIAHIKIDTTNYNVHQLRKIIVSNFGGEGNIVIQLTSFGFKFGIPKDADMIFDVRFVKNPNFVEELKNLDGTDERIINYVFSDNSAREYKRMIEDMLLFLIDKFKEEGKSVVNICIGCTGGKHRSVSFVEEIAKNLSKKYNIIVIHRDKDK